MTHVDQHPPHGCGSTRRRPNGRCAKCHSEAAARRRKLEKAAGPKPATAIWLPKAATYTHCPCCGLRWDQVHRPPRQKLPFQQGHILALEDGGSNDLANLQPECERCNLGKRRSRRRTT